MKTTATMTTATIYFADISPLLEQAVYDRLRILVPEDRRAKADSMKFERGRAQSLGAGLLLREACNDMAARMAEDAAARMAEDAAARMAEDAAARMAEDAAARMAEDAAARMAEDAAARMAEDAAARMAEDAAARMAEDAAARMAGFREAHRHISYGEHGKPDFDPKWLEENGFGEMHFSLSHSGNRVMCGISSAPVGCDVEIVKLRDMKIAKRFFCEEEYKDIMAQPCDDARAERFFRYWTLKESVIKCEGRGLGMPLNSFRIELADRSCIGDEAPNAKAVTGARLVLKEKTEVYGCGEYTLREFDLEDGCKYACCVAAGEVEVQKKQIDLCGLK